MRLTRRQHICPWLNYRIVVARPETISDQCGWPLLPEFYAGDEREVGGERFLVCVGQSGEKDTAKWKNLSPFFGAVPEHLLVPA